MQQTAGSVKGVQLKLSGSNLQLTTQSHSKTPGDNKQGTRQSPQGPRRINGKSSDLRLKGYQFTPRHQETRSWWQVQFTARDLKRHLLWNLRWRHSHCQVITMSSTEDKLLKILKGKPFFSSIFKHYKCFASLCCLVIILPAKTPVNLSAFQKKVCCLVITAFNLNYKTVISIVLSFTEWKFCSIIMNHLLGPYACRRPHWWSPGSRGRRTRAETYPAEMFPWLQKNIQMAAIYSPLFDYVVLNFLLKLQLVEVNFVGQKKCAYYQSWTQFSIKTLSSTNIWLMWITCMVCNDVLKIWGKRMTHSLTEWKNQWEKP